jgi:hypothetical protein
MSTVSRSSARTAYPAGVLGSGVTCKRGSARAAHTVRETNVVVEQPDVELAPFLLRTRARTSSSCGAVAIFAGRGVELEYLSRYEDRRELERCLAFGQWRELDVQLRVRVGRLCEVRGRKRAKRGECTVKDLRVPSE